MKEQTAVEWLAEQLLGKGVKDCPNGIVNQAKAMQLEQMEDAYDKGKTYDCMAPDDSFDAYYNKYYEKEGDYDDYQERLKYLKDL